MNLGIKFLEYAVMVLTLIVVAIGLLLMSPGIISLRYALLIFVINNALVFIALVLYAYLTAMLWMGDNEK